MRVNFDLRAKFLISITVAFIAIGTVIYFVSGNETKKYFLDITKKDVAGHVQRHAERYFDLSKPLSLKITGNYKEYAESLEGVSILSNISVVDPSGTVIYSKNTSNIGKMESANSAFISAINGNTVFSNIDYGEKVSDFASPIKSEDESVRGVVMGQASLSELISNTNSFTNKLILLVGSILFVFVTTFYVFFSGATKSMEEQDRSIVDKSKALEEEQNLDEAIMSSIAESLIVINKDGQIVLFNPEAERITGHKVDEVEYRLYKKVLIFYDKDGKEIKDNPITNCLKSGERTEVKIKDGYYIKNSKKDLSPVSVAVAPIITKNDEVRGVAATIQDISVEKELDKIKDEFVYVVAHELGNPVFAIDGYLSILEDKSREYDSKTKEIIRSARGVNQQLSSLVNDLLEAVRNEQGQLTFETVKVDLGTIIKETARSASFKAKTKKIKVDYLESKIPNVMANEQKIREVATNLIDNAIKYTPNGGKIEIFHEIADDMLVTHVKDNGFGMNKEEQEKLFDKFYRIKNDQTKGISGTGLGLFICRQIIEKSGGKIWAESEEGEGSTFSFALKIAKK